MNRREVATLWIVRFVDRHEFGTLVQPTCTGETLDHINGSVGYSETCFKTGAFRGFAISSQC